MVLSEQKFVTRLNIHVSFTLCYFVCLFLARQPPLGQGLLIHEVSRSHSDAPHSVGLLWTSDRLVAETSTRQHTTLTTGKHLCPWWDSKSQSQQASGRRPTP